MEIAATRPPLISCKVGAMTARVPGSRLAPLRTRGPSVTDGTTVASALSPRAWSVRGSRTSPESTTTRTPAKAAALFLEKGNTLDAARLYGVAGAWDKAAELYSKSGYPLRAAEAFEKAGNALKAAECYEKHFMENVSFSTSFSSTGPSADQKSARLAGQLRLGHRHTRRYQHDL